MEILDKVHQTMRDKLGGQEQFSAHMREIASKGGKAKVKTKGTGSLTREERIAMGKKGGRPSHKGFVPKIKDAA